MKRKTNEIIENGIYVYSGAYNDKHFSKSVYWVVGSKDKVADWLNKKNINHPPTYANVDHKFFNNGTELYYEYNPWTGD